MTVAVRGLEFDVEVAGPEGAATVLLLHGYPQNATMWADLAPRLHAEGLRTVAPTQRGYSPGARPSDVDAYRVDEVADDALAILDAFGVDAAHVVGHDWGALVGWRLASRDPARVRTLTAASVPHPLAMAKAIVSDPDQRERSGYVGLYRTPGKAEELLLADDARRLRGMLTRTGHDAAGIDRYVRPLQEPGALTAALNWYRAINLAEPVKYDTVGVPTTFVWSDEDVAIGRAAAEGCIDFVTGEYRFVALGGVSHWIPDEAPEEFAAAVLHRVKSSAPPE